MKHLVPVVLLVATFGVSLRAGSTFYVSPSGNDSNDGSLSSPWRTVQKAANTLTAGQTAQLRAGTYREHDIQFAHSGTAGNPITVKAYAGETPVIDGGYTISSGRHPVFNIDGPDYITLDGLTVQRGSTANVYLSYNNGADHFTFQNGVCQNYVTDDNAGCFYLNPLTTSVTITNNTIDGRIKGGASNNVGNGIVLFRVDGFTITNNTIGNQVNGIYIKHDNAGFTKARLISRNIIHDSLVGATLSGENITFSHNVISNASLMGVKVFEDAGTCPAGNNTIRHNTILPTSRVGFGIVLNSGVGGSCPGATNTLIYDNLIGTDCGSEFRCVSVWAYATSTDNSKTTLHHNLVYTASFASAALRVLGTNYSLMSPPGSVQTSGGNIQAAPTFSNASSGDYHLTATSKGHAAASDGEDMGAYTSSVKCVGVTTNCL